MKNKFMVFVGVLFLLLTMPSMSALEAPRIITCKYYQYGSEDPDSSNYYNLKPVEIKKVFEEYENISILVKYDQIIGDRRWKVEVQKGLETVMSEESEWSKTSVGNFSYTKDCVIDKEGEYLIKIWLDKGKGFELIGEKDLIVVKKRN